MLYWILHEGERVGMVWRAIRTIAAPFFSAAVLGSIINVPMRGIEDRLGFLKDPALRRGAALALTILAVALTVYLLIWLLLPQVAAAFQALLDQLPVFLEGLLEAGRGLSAAEPKLVEWIYSHTELEKMDWSALTRDLIPMAADHAQAFLAGVISAIGSVSNVLLNGVVGLGLALYGLARKETLARQARRLLYAFLPEKASDEIVRLFRLSNETFSAFLSGQCLDAAILGCMFAVAMTIFRMPYVPLISLLIAVTALVPIVGAFVGCVLGALFIFVEDPGKAVWFVGLFLAIQQIEGDLIYPKIVGDSVGLPGMWVMVAVIVGGELMGVFGMLMMVPLFSVLYTVICQVIAYRLEQRKIDEDKLRHHPPDMQRRRREKRLRAKYRSVLKAQEQAGQEKEGKAE